MVHSDGAGAADAPLDSHVQLDHQHVADTFARLAIELHDADGVVETVEAVAQFALQALNCSYAGITLYTRGGRPEVAAVTDPVVAEAYQMQLDSETGPLVTCLRERSTVLIRDTTTEQRWPDWAAKVSALGVRSVLDVPLVTGSDQCRTVGVLGLYSPDPDAFGADDEAIAHILARHASVAVATARHEISMAHAVDARKLVGQAMGILMERFDVDGDRAFAILRRYSQDTNTKLRDVAQQLIDTRRLPAEGQGHTNGAGT
ncbi:GAF and ANTAR domain-containing protein [Kribbella qitaiheensis]|uniref:GAF and ANTAR domain-containing protein n=1 Tax=Kribbella qitaiheensis TaxID=1544730 RepID=A0A7G6WS66_9ACTN|nr:GAF and ANTAR domain-containing protein [Kribbella qitaiheensis]QNE16831.1 GAF and ANTAR domain-containing protein [Kribbella qitaiheensis]